MSILQTKRQHKLRNLLIAQAKNLRPQLTLEIKMLKIQYKIVHLIVDAKAELKNYHNLLKIWKFQQLILKIGIQ